LRELLKELFLNIPSGVGTGGRIKLGPRQIEDVLADGVAWAVENGYGWDSDKEYCEENGTMKTAKPNMVSPTAKKRGAPQLGSLGSGNHFVEIQKVDKIYNPQAAKTFGLHEGQIVIMAHTGSRGLGYQVCSDYLRVVEGAAKRYGIELPDRELACAPINSKEAEDYLGAMNAALNFAWSNRQMITHWTRRAFEKVLGSSSEGFEMNLVYDVSHNIAKIEEHNIDDSKRKVMVHRKGATRAFPKGRTEVPIMYRKVGQPVLIPGSMGTASYVLVGAPKSMDVSFGSTAHGAGRMMSRSAAVRRWRGEDVKRELAGRGIHIESASWKGVAEEAPEAYKDVDAVAEVSDSAGIATRVVRLVPMGVVKG
jgi:tRNA-splicing ligase RtcB